MWSKSPLHIKFHSYCGIYMIFLNINLSKKNRIKFLITQPLALQMVNSSCKWHYEISMCTFKEKFHWKVVKIFHIIIDRGWDTDVVLSMKQTLIYTNKFSEINEIGYILYILYIYIYIYIEREREREREKWLIPMLTPDNSAIITKHPPPRPFTQLWCDKFYECKYVPKRVLWDSISL